MVNEKQTKETENGKQSPKKSLHTRSDILARFYSFIASERKNAYVDLISAVYFDRFGIG